MLARFNHEPLVRVRTIERSAIVPYTCEQMFALINDVEGYPDFLSWCDDASVLADDQSEMRAKLTVSLAGIKQSFVTKNALSPPHEMQLKLVDGPFEALDGAWRLYPLGDSGCKIALHLSFEFAHQLLSAAFEGAFSKVAKKLVDDFTYEARERYA